LKSYTGLPEADSWLGPGEENDEGRRGKVVSVYDIKAYGESRGIAPLILNLGASWR
jgi:hypothetical protein